jgi:hypothetical protein
MHVWYLPLDLSFMGSNSAEGGGFLRVIKIHRTPSFAGQVKQDDLCCNILWHIKSHFEV